MKHEFADDNASRLTRGWQINHEVAYLRASTDVACDASGNLRTNVSLNDGSNSFTAVALDSYGRTDTNTVSAWLPATAAMKYDLNGNLTNDSRRVLIYDDENQLTKIIVTNASGRVTKSEFTYDGKMRRRLRKESTLASGNWNPVAEIRYVYDGMLVVQERHFAPQRSTNSHQQLVTYTRGRDLGGTLEGAGGIGGAGGAGGIWGGGIAGPPGAIGGIIGGAIGGLVGSTIAPMMSCLRVSCAPN